MRKHQANAAMEFYEKKLQNYPEMPRYLHNVATLAEELGQIEKADQYFRQTVENSSNDIMVQNDFAMHLFKQNRKQDAIHELNKGLILVENNAVLQKNLGAILGQKGQFKEGLEWATKASHLNPNDAMNHRNLAKLNSALGDSRSALQHNLIAIELEKINHVDKPNTKAFRAAAVQIISKGGDRSEAIGLINAARQLEGKTFELPTTIRTYEIINKIKSKQGNKMAQLEKERQEEEQRLQTAADIGENKLNPILKFREKLQLEPMKPSEDEHDPQNKPAKARTRREKKGNTG